MSQTTITDIGTVGIPVSDQDKAVEFFTGTLGFEKRLDARMGESFRWVTVAAPGASTSVALILHRISELSPEGHILMIDPHGDCLLYTSPSPRDTERSRMPSSA